MGETFLLLSCGAAFMTGVVIAPPRAFQCPHCRANYKVIRTEAGKTTKHREIVCLSCGGNTFSLISQPAAKIGRGLMSSNRHETHVTIQA